MSSQNKESLLQALTNLTAQDARQVQWQAELKNENWISVQAAMTRLFQLRRYPELAAELPSLNDKLSRLSKSEIGLFIGEFYQDQLLKKCMIILREEIREEQGDVLLQKLAQIWTAFYTSILPTLQAFFATVQLKGLSIRALTLISFRDVVVLKTAIADSLENSEQPPPADIKQMLLVLQSVHRSPPTPQYFQLVDLVTQVVSPYICMVTHKPSESGVANESPLSATTVKRYHSIGTRSAIVHSVDTEYRAQPDR